MKQIVALNVLEGYRVWLRFADGAEGMVDFSTKPRLGVYAAWQDYANFRRARIGDHGELVWDEEIDFCPDALWLQVTGQSAQALETEIKSPAYA